MMNCLAYVGKMRAVKVTVRGVHKEGVVEPFYTVETIPDTTAAGDGQAKEIQTTRQRLVDSSNDILFTPFSSLQQTYIFLTTLFFIMF